MRVVVLATQTGTDDDSVVSDVETSKEPPVSVSGALTRISPENCLDNNQIVVVIRES